MTALEKYRRLFRELFSARNSGVLLDETEAHFTQALDDCFARMSDEERKKVGQEFRPAVFVVRRAQESEDPRLSALNYEVTDAVFASERALSAAVAAFKRLRDAETNLSNYCVDGEERRIADRGFGGANMILCVLMALENE
jgi:hypothetical protein